MPRIQGRIDPDGAVVRVTVTIGEADETDRLDRGLSLPQPFATTGLIDTGASRTTIHPMIAQSLDLIPDGFASLATPGRAVADVALYDVRLALGHAPLIGPPIQVQAPAVAPATLGTLVIVGRDLLERCTLLFDGENKAFSLWF